MHGQPDFSGKPGFSVQVKLLAKKSKISFYNDGLIIGSISSHSKRSRNRSSLSGQSTSPRTKAKKERYTILQQLDTDVHSTVTAKTSTALWQRKRAQRCDSGGADSNVTALTVTVTVLWHQWLWHRCDSDVYISVTAVATDTAVTAVTTDSAVSTVAADTAVITMFTLVWQRWQLTVLWQR